MQSMENIVQQQWIPFITKLTQKVFTPIYQEFNTLTPSCVAVMATEPQPVATTSRFLTLRQTSSSLFYSPRKYGACGVE